MYNEEWTIKPFKTKQKQKNKKIKSTVVQVDPNQSLQYKFPNKMIVDLSLTIGSVLLIMAISFFIYIISSTHATVDYTTVEYFYLLMMPISFNSVSVSFYLKNPNVRKIIFWECGSTFIHCNQ